MSSSSDFAPSGDDPQEGSCSPSYVSAPHLIWRTVLDGAVARRWDTDAGIVMLNPSAWMVVEALLSGHSPMDLEDVVRSIEARATFDPSGIDDLRHVLDDLVRCGLVLALD